MTAAAGTGASSRRGSKALPWIAGLVALALVALVAGRPGTDSGGPPFDPASTGPDGAKALVLLLESFGADVDSAANRPSADTEVAFMFTDVIAESDQGAVEDWIESGGVLVVADPYSVWSAPVTAGSDLAAFGLGAGELAPGECDMAQLRPLTAIEPGGYVERFEAPVGARSCFTDAGIGDPLGPFVVEQPVGRGRIVSVGGPGPFINDLLDEADNAALATALLLSPSPSAELDGGPIDVALLQYGGSALDDRSLTDTMGTGAKIALVQLMVAFVIYAWYRARRVGRPIVESQPVALAGSELVSAVGQLLQQSDDPDRSARALRADVRRRLGERYGLGPHASPGVIATVVAERTGVGRGRLFAILDTRPVTTDRELVQLAAEIDDLRKEILHGP